MKLYGSAGLSADVSPLPTAQGGAPAIDPDMEAEDEKSARKLRKRAAKLQREANQPPDSFERFRILSELVDEGRRVIDLADHKARYALVVIGVVNTSVLLLLTRGHLIADLPTSSQPWLIGLMVVYAALTFLFFLHVIDCLRPRRLHYADRFTGQTERGGINGSPRGLLFWEAIANYDVESYKQAWSQVRMAQINAEVVLIAHQQAQLIRAKYSALGRLYMGLVVLVILGGLLLAVYAGFAITS
jgi:hypothetical protein